jgi:polar amino acid transport system substrate-binding protein
VRRAPAYDARGAGNRISCTREERTEIMVRLRLAGILAATVVVALLAAGASGAARNAAAAQTFVFCTDITYPPEEFFQGTKPAGSDIDIGTELAKRMGLKAQFNNTGFDGIIAALLAKKCDAIISGMNDTPERRKQVAFVDYISVGQSLMVKKGNPKGIKTLADLSGKTVSVEVGTTNKQFLDAQNKLLKKQGKPSIKITTFPHDTDAANALKTGRVDAYFGDSPVVAYYIARDPSFGFAGSPINPIPVGIALRKGDSRVPAVRKQIAAMYADGTMAKILKKWKMEAFALKK